MKWLITGGIVVLAIVGISWSVYSKDQKTVSRSLDIIREGKGTSLSELNSIYAKANAEALKIKIPDLRESALKEIEKINDGKKKTVQDSNQFSEEAISLLSVDFSEISQLDNAFDIAMEKLSKIPISSKADSTKKALTELHEKHAELIAKNKKLEEERKQLDRERKELERDKKKAIARARRAERAQRNAEDRAQRETREREAAERREAQASARRNRDPMCCCKVTYYEADNFEEDWEYKETSYVWIKASKCTTKKTKTLSPFTPDKKWERVSVSSSSCGR